MRSAGDALDTLGLSRASGATEFILVRHADALPTTGEHGAAYDDQPLSPRGRMQADAAAAALAETGVDAVYASPTRRAIETGTALAERCAVPVRVDAALREVAIGEFALDGDAQRDTATAIRARLAILAVTALRDGTWSAIPGTEPSHAVRTRARNVLARIAAAHPGERVAVVSHAGTINAFLADMLGLERDFFFPIANASFSHVRLGGERRLLVSCNETQHLRGLAIV
jgi:broad specificity phosphatase PhoE